MTKEQKNTQRSEAAEPKAKSIQFPLESFLKKLKEEQHKKTKNPPDNPDISG